MQEQISFECLLEIPHHYDKARSGYLPEYFQKHFGTGERNNISRAKVEIHFGKR